MKNQNDLDIKSALWFSGTTRQGKTSNLVDEFQQWVNKQLNPPKNQKSSFVQSDLPQDRLASVILVFAANNHNRRELANRLAVAIEGTYPINCKTPVGFITDEVMLFWPLIFEKLQLKAQFPLRLRPETEQELATKLWRNEADWDILTKTIPEYSLVRQSLDLFQLAATSGTPIEELAIILEQGLTAQEPAAVWQRMAELLIKWRKWSLERALLSYGLIYELYWRYLLLHPTYQDHLTRRYRGIFADDVDDYPAIALDLFEFLLDSGAFGVFTYNPNGKIRLGLNADPNYLEGLAKRCQVKELSNSFNCNDKLAQQAIALVNNTPTFITLPETIESIQTISRAELLRKTTEIIIEAVKQNIIQPAEIAIIAPGLDEIARYTLIEIFTASGIAIKPLNEQRPLIASPLVRALLTLLALIYPGLGRLVDSDAIAEMLTILSSSWVSGKLVPEIDPVRAGLLADYCYHIDPDQPYLLPIESFARWDRLGHKATNAYLKIAAWIEQQKSQQQSSFFNPTILLDRAINYFLARGNHLPYDKLANLKELMETAQHFWEVDRRLRQNEPSFQTQSDTIAQFIYLLRRGTITANPRPIQELQPQPNAITLATIFQYRSLRSAHRWQFWLDAASPLWEQGGAATLFAAHLFLKEWSGKVWLPEDEYEMNRQRLERILQDLIGRASEKIFLCHSDLGVNGTEQTGPLLALVHASQQNLSNVAELKIS
ncbi:MAG: recombinase family protein [Stanieria sp.]